jgi:P pilus assembly chaperone PapD
METTFPSNMLFQDGQPEINNTCITISVRNIGTKYVTVTKIYIGNQPHPHEPTQIQPRSAKTFYLSGTYFKGATYTVKLEYSINNDKRYTTFKVSYPLPEEP